MTVCAAGLGLGQPGLFLLFCLWSEVPCAVEGSLEGNSPCDRQAAACFVSCGLCQLSPCLSTPQPSGHTAQAVGNVGSLLHEADR